MAQRGEASVLSSVSKSMTRSTALRFDETIKENGSQTHSLDLFENCIFPVVTEANRSRKVNVLIKLIEFFFIYIQIFLSAFNDFVPYEDADPSYVTFLKFFYIGLIGEAEDVIPFVIMIIAIDFVTISFLLAAHVDYHINREYRKWMLFILRYWHGHLFGIFMIPNFIMIMSTFSLVGYYNDASSYVLVVLGSIFGVASIYILLMFLPFYSRNPYLSTAWISAWDIRKIYIGVFIISIPMGLAALLKETFMTWIELVPLFLEIVMSVYLFYQSCHFPFRGIFFNAIVMAEFIALFVSLIMSVTEIFTPMFLPDSIFYTIPLMILVAAAIIIYIILYAIRNRIFKQLCYSSFVEENTKPSEDQKREYIESLKINTVDKAQLYLQIGFEEMSDLFVDWSLFRYYFDAFPDKPELLVYMAWLVALFPSEIQLLHKYLTQRSKMHEISRYDQCLFFQIHRIHIFRQSSASHEASLDFSKIKSITDQTIFQFCRFWQNLSNPNIEFDPSTYAKLANMRIQAEAMWSESLDKYPNHARFAHEYARFLLEVCCDFKKSIYQHQHALELDNGTRLQNDRTFRHFVLAYPKYLKKGVVDIRGTLKGPIQRKKLTSSNSTQSKAQSTSKSSKGISQISTLSTLSTNADEDSDQIDLQEGAKFLPQMHLRLALQRAVKNLQSPSLIKVRISNICRVICSILFVIIFAVLISPLFNDRETIFSVYNQLDIATKNMQLISIQIPWLMYEGINGGQLDYTEFLSKVQVHLGDFESDIDFSKSFNQIITGLAAQALESMNNLAFTLYGIDFQSLDQLVVFKDVFLVQQRSSYSCAYLDDQLTPLIFNDSMTTDLMMRTMITLTRRLLLDKTETVRGWGTKSPNFCEHYTNQILLDEFLKSVMVSISTPLYDSFGDIYVEGGEEESTGDTPEEASLHHNKLQKNTKKIKSLKKEILKKVKSFERKSSKMHIKVSEEKSGAEEEIVAEEGGEEEVVEEEEEEEMDDVDAVCNFFITFTPFAMILFILPNLIFLSAGIKNEIVNFSKILKSVPSQDCLKAAETIQKVYATQTKNSKHKEKIASANVNKYVLNIPQWLVTITSALIVIALLLIGSIITLNVRTTLNNINEYYALFITQRDLLFVAGREALYTNLFIELSNEGIEGFDENQNYTSPQNSIARCKLAIEEFKVVTNMLNAGTESLSSVISMDSELNSIRYDPICDKKVETDETMDYYKCVSFERVISYFMQSINSYILLVENNLNNSVPMLKSDMPYISHILDTRIATGFDAISAQLYTYYQSQISLFHTILIVSTVISVIFVLLESILENILIQSIHRQFETFKCLILRMNPITFVANSQLLSAVYGKGERDSSIISASHAVFITSHDAMISLNEEGVIESINPSATTIFGYTPEQMLGQHLKMLFNQDTKENSQLLYNMQLMQSGQTSLIYEAEVSGTRDDESQVPLKVTLLGLSSDSRTAESFAIMCRDQTEEMKQKTAVEEAKKQSEQLLLQILPKDIIMRLNRGDQDINFTVPSASISFIDIEKFSNYSASLSASEIMQNLGLVFTAYDQILHKYDLIIKIKLIGDDYMSAAGLFNTDVDPSSHAIQMVKFALECLDAIEELNEQLNASLQVRIGINTGGPLIAGVLGTDKPLFDIIGDPINVAARLQSTDIPGLVQISKACYELIANENFEIEPRGEVELKGKGKQMTYLVHPSRLLEFHDNSQATFDLQVSSENAIDPEHYIAPDQLESFINETINQLIPPELTEPINADYNNHALTPSQSDL